MSKRHRTQLERIMEAHSGLLVGAGLIYAAAWAKHLRQGYKNAEGLHPFAGVKVSLPDPGAFLPDVVPQVNVSAPVSLPGLSPGLADAAAVINEAVGGPMSTSPSITNPLGLSGFAGWGLNPIGMAASYAGVTKTRGPTWAGGLDVEPEDLIALLVALHVGMDAMQPGIQAATAVSLASLEELAQITAAGIASLGAQQQIAAAAIPG